MKPLRDTRYETATRAWPLNDPGASWRVIDGTVELYAVFLDELGRPAAPRQWLGVVEAGGIMRGVASAPSGAVWVGLLALPVGAVRLAPAPLVDREDEAGWYAALGLDPALPTAEAQTVRLGALGEQRQQANLARATRLSDQTARDQRRQTAARRRLHASQLSGTRWRTAEADTFAQLWSTLQLVLAEHHLRLEKPRRTTGIEDLARQMRLRHRLVRLDAGLLQNDMGPLLIAPSEGRGAQALLPARNGYRLVDTQSGTDERLTQTHLNSLPSHAWRFYPTLPSKALNLGDLLARIVNSSRRDIWRIALMALMAAGLGLVTPMAFQFVFDAVVPQGQPDALVSVGLGLFGLIVGRSVIHAAQQAGQVRLGALGKSALTSALWDRLLHLETNFFRRWTAGELAERLDGLERLRQAILQLLLNGMIALLSGLFAFALMISYHGLLSLALVPPAGVMILLLAVQGAWLIRWQKREAELDGRLAALVLQTFVGIRKLRLAAAESRVFARWANLYAEQRRVAMTSGRITRSFIVLRGLIEAGMAGVIFYATSNLAGADFSIGRFIAFMTAFGMFQAALLTVTDDCLELLRTWPLLERARPLLQAQPEGTGESADPGVLKGSVSAEDVHFAYDSDGPAVLDDVSLRIEPGEFVAIVGPSGSGKSTLLRLLIGFERPDSGGVFIDGRDLTHLDRQAYRRQLGVVLQNDKLIAGSVLTNVRAAHQASIEEVWQALSDAGIADEVAQWPMNLHTVIAEGSSTISGGQRQRLLLARALLAKPRIVMLDEATSALDNHSQAQIMRNLNRLSATRIVIAHRLETIRAADRIVVMAEGRVVQVGKFDELLTEPGVFQSLYGNEKDV